MVCVCAAIIMECYDTRETREKFVCTDEKFTPRMHYIKLMCV